MNIKAIRPEIFKNEPEVDAFVTLKNENLYNDTRSIPGLNLGFNTDESAEIVKQNRQVFIEAFGLDEDWTAYANQVHSNRVTVVANGGVHSNTDGLITKVPGLALAIQIADCPAVLISDLSSGIIAAVHAGWRGAAGNIVPRAMEKMVQHGAEMSRCKAFISPCICVDHFEVGAEVAEQFPPSFVDCEHYRKPHVNLKAYLHHQLRQVGVKDENIEIHLGCTMGEERYYSYRREGEKSGRMMAVIRLGKENIH